MIRIGRRLQTTLPRLLAFLAVVATFSPLASAHIGPPFPIINDRTVGPCVISLWTHPDVGIGTFFVIVNPAPGARIPDDLKIMIGVQPVTGRLREARYRMDRESPHGQVQFDASVPFDRQELWRATVYLSSSVGGGNASATVEVTPPGFGAWGLLLFSLPFVGIGYLWFRAATRKRNRIRTRKKQPPPPKVAERPSD